MRYSYLLMFLLLLPVVFGVNDAHNRYTMDSLTYGIGDIITGVYNFSNTGTVIVPGIIGNATDFEQSDTDRMTTSFNLVNGLTGFTACVWVNPESYPAAWSTVFSYYGVTGGRFGYFMVAQASKTLYNRIITEAGEMGSVYSNTAIQLNSWSYLCQVWNGTHGLVYYNGTLDITPFLAAGNAIVADTNPFTLGAISTTQTANLWDGLMDDLLIFNRSLSSTEIMTLYTDGYGGGGAPPVTGSSINMSESFPGDLSGFNVSTINFNVSVNASNNFNCSLYLNATYQQVITYSAAFGVNANFNNTFGVVESDYTYQIRCDDGVSKSNSTTKTIRVDTVQPNIYTNFNTNQRWAMDYLSGQINASDTYLYGFNLSLDSNKIINYSGLTGGTLSYNLSVNVSNYTAGLHNITVCAWDAHTDSDIEDYSFEKRSSDKALKYSWGDDWVTVRPEKPTNYADHDTYKAFDRYVFDYTRTNAGVSEQIFFVESSQPIEIIQNSKYQGHLVIPALNKWLDFETEQKFNVKVVRKSSTLVQVQVEAVTGEKLVFNSIGDLNIVCTTNQWDKVNFTLFGGGFGTEQTKKEFNVSFEYGLSYTITSFLEFGGVNYSATNKSDMHNVSLNLGWNVNDSQLTPYKWHFFIQGEGNKTNTTKTFSFQQFKMVLGDCSSPAYNDSSISFLFFNEVNITSPTLASFEGVISIWKNALYVRNYSYSIAIPRHNQSLCMYPLYETFFASGFIDYTNITSTTKRYNLNLTATNTTQNINLYLSANATAVPVVMTVIDRDGFPLPAVTIKLQRYYSSTNSYQEVNQLTTDFQGQARFLISLYTIEYRFIFEYPSGNVVDITPKAYIIDDTLKYQLILSDRPIDDVFNDLGLYGNISHNNNTGVFTYYFVDIYSDITGGCLYLYEKIGGHDRTPLGINCTTGISGTLTYKVTAIDGRTYIAEGYVTKGGMNQYITSDSYTQRSVPNFGTSILFFVSLITFVVAVGIGGSLPMSVAITPLPGLLMAAFGMITIGVPVMAGLQLLALIIAGIIARGYN